MKPFPFFVLVLVTILVMIALSNVPLVQDWVGHQCGVGSWCSGPDEFWGGVAAIFIILYTAMLALTVR